MCEITNKNFDEKYLEIVHSILEAHFISIDCEFSGLHTHGPDKISLFDTPAERYTKVRKSIQDFVAFQIGISTFIQAGEGDFVASTYTFYVFQRKYSSQNLVSSCESNSIEFLCSQGFDFNKVFYEGITFASIENEKALETDIQDGSMLSRLKTQMTLAEKDLLRKFSSKADEWCKTAETGKSFFLDASELEPFLRYLLKLEIESRWPDVKVTRGHGLNLHVHKIGEGEDEVVGESEQDRKEELLILSLGFTRIIKEIISVKVPIIGHNMLLDLLMLYKMFFKPLPDRYEDFKREISRIFPRIYDTKFISYRLKRKMKGIKLLWTSNALNQLYEFFKKEKCIVLYMPCVAQKNGTVEHFHDSGFDSYCTGHIFLKLAHMASMWDDGLCRFRNASLGNSTKWYFSVVRNMENRINLMRSNSKYINLSGSDPVGPRPHLVLVESRDNNPIEFHQIAETVNKFEGLDVCLLSKRQVLIASPNQEMARSIYKILERELGYNVSNYSRGHILPCGSVWAFLTLMSGLFFVYYVGSTR